MPQRSAEYQGNKGGECNAVERLAHVLRVNFICPYCGRDLRKVKTVSMDHVKPQLHGGKKSDSNIVAACGSCNSSKQAKTLGQFSTIRKDPDMTRRVRKCARRKLPLETARALMGVKK